MVCRILFCLFVCRVPTLLPGNMYCTVSCEFAFLEGVLSFRGQRLGKQTCWVLAWALAWRRASIWAVSLRGKRAVWRRLGHVRNK